MGLIVSLDSYAERKQEIAEQSLFFGCLPVKVPPQRSYLSTLDWVSCNDEDSALKALTTPVHDYENQWGFWNCERSISSHELAPFRHLSE